MYSDEEIKNLISEAGFKAANEQIEQLKSYCDLLLEKNKVMNLTAITDFDEVIVKHFLDSLLIGKILQDLNEIKEAHIKSLCEARIADIGTGGGFPGIPLKILAPETDITLIDSLNKRIGFLNETIDRLELTKIRALHGRSEDLGKQPEYREKYDYVLSRAVANLAVLSEYCIPFVKEGGLFVSYKGEKVEEEAKNADKAIKTLGGNLIGIKKCKLPGTDMTRSFAVIKKERKTPKAYPRKAGVPAKQPL